MFAETLTITINAQAKALVRINQDGYSSEYYLRETDSEYRMRIRNTSYTDKNRGNRKVDRHNVELVHTLFPVAPDTVQRIRKSYFVFENEAGDSILLNAKHSVGMNAFLTEANITRMLNWES